MHLNFIDPKIDIFQNKYLKIKNSEITEILQKRHNTEI